jgi:hypothetical protein
MVSDVLVAPESLMLGFFRTPAGPGWALLGDACRFKHPGTAQGARGRPLGTCGAVVHRELSGRATYSGHGDFGDRYLGTR